MCKKKRLHRKPKTIILNIIFLMASTFDGKKGLFHMFWWMNRTWILNFLFEVIEGGKLKCLQNREEVIQYPISKNVDTKIFYQYQIASNKPILDIP